MKNVPTSTNQECRDIALFKFPNTILILQLWAFADTDINPMRYHHESKTLLLLIL